jgi:hypothetical protein
MFMSFLYAGSQLSLVLGPITGRPDHTRKKGSVKVRTADKFVTIYEYLTIKPGVPGA